MLSLEWDVGLLLVRKAPNISPSMYDMSFANLAPLALQDPFHPANNLEAQRAGT